MKSPLAQRIPENALQDLVAPVTRPESVPMPDVIGLAMDFTHHGMVMDARSELLGEVVAHPHVMVAYEIVDHHPGIREFSKFPKDAGIPLRNRLSVFKPEIEDIAHQVQFRSAVLNTAQPFHKMPFPHQASRGIGSTQVQVGGEIDFFVGIHAAAIYTTPPIPFNLPISISFFQIPLPFPIFGQLDFLLI